MNYDPEAVAVAFQRLFRTYRFVDPEEADEMLSVYFEALREYETRDIEAGVGNMLAGKVDGFNPSFLPPAPLVAKSVRDAMNVRLDAEARERRARPALPPPDTPKNADNRARVKAMVAEALKNLSMHDIPKAADNEATRAAYLKRHDERFHGAAYTVGDEDAGGDMGQRGAA